MVTCKDDDGFTLPRILFQGFQKEPDLSIHIVDAARYDCIIFPLLFLQYVGSAHAQYAA